MVNFGEIAVRPLGDADREWFLQALGLAELEFLFEERIGDWVARRWTVRGADRFPEFPSEPLSAATPPVLVRQHLALHLAEQPFLDGDDLWELFLPFPMRLWAEPPSQVQARGGVVGSEPAWLASAQTLRGALEGLRKLLERAEVSLLEMAPRGQAARTYFFHCVRGRFTLVGAVEGTLPEAEDGSEPLARLGASTQRLPLPLPGRPSDLESAATYLKRAVADLAIQTPVSALRPSHSGSDVVIRTDS